MSRLSFRNLILGIALYASAPSIIHAVDAGLTPEQAVSTLKSGNERFLSGHPNYPNLTAARRELIASGEHPFAAVLTCSDSRVAPELLFDAGLGELFVVRVDGNVADNDEIASLEYAVEQLHVPVITVLGHSQCAAVSAVTRNAAQNGSRSALYDNILPAVRDARALNGKKSDDELLNASVQFNVFQSMADILARSSIIREQVAEGKTRLIGGVYMLPSGAVNWLGQHPEQEILLTRHDETVPVHPPIATQTDQTDHPDDQLVQNAFAAKQSDGVTSRTALARLVEGNLRFADDPETSAQRPNRTRERRNQLAKGEHPWAAILTCADSRVAPEHLFDVGLGDLSVVRVAGNVADLDEIGSLEHAVGDLKTPLIVVLGHTDCGAVTAACTGGELAGNMPELLDNMEPAIERANHRIGKDSTARITMAIRENVFQSMSDLMTHSAELTAYVQSGAIRIVGGIYHLETGRIEWLGELPDQSRLVASLITDKQLGIELEEVVAPGSSPTPKMRIAPQQSTPLHETDPQLQLKSTPAAESGESVDAHPATTSPHH